MSLLVIARDIGGPQAKPLESYVDAPSERINIKGGKGGLGL
jgi:hypothetical protein